MIVNIQNVQSQEEKKYIKQEGYYTLKCVEVKFLKNSSNNNPIYRITFKNKNEEYFNDDITITDGTKWRIKQLADAFGFKYQNINIFHFKNMYLVANLVAKKVRNSVGDIVQILEVKSYRKSSKLENTIPPENSRVEPEIIYEEKKDIYNEINIEIKEDDIPF